MRLPRKFTDDQVRAIRQSSSSARDVAQEYDVTHATILNIRNRRAYKHVPDHLGHAPSNEYFIADALPFLQQLPAGYCETVIAAPAATRGPAFSRLRHEEDAGSTPSPRNPSRSRRSVIQECIRIAGPGGVVFYLHSFANAHPYARGMNLRSSLASGLPLRQIIIVDHQQTDRIGFLKTVRRMSMLPNTYDVIFMFAGQHWSVPQETMSVAARWGDVWRVESLRPPTRGGHPWHTPGLSVELASRCVALGRGRVLVPFAGSGDAILAAIDAGRDWLACDTDEGLRREFENRMAESKLPPHRRL